MPASRKHKKSSAPHTSHGHRASSKVPASSKDKKSSAPHTSRGHRASSEESLEPWEPYPDHSDYTYYHPPRPQEGQPYNHQARNEAGHVLLSQPSHHGATPFHNSPRESAFTSAAPLQPAHVRHYDPNEASRPSSYHEPTSGPATPYDASSNYHQSTMHHGDLDYQPIPEEDRVVVAEAGSTKSGPAKKPSSRSESDKKYYAKNRDGICDKRKKHTEITPEKKQEYDKTHYNKHRDKILARNRAYKERVKRDGASPPPSG